MAKGKRLDYETIICVSDLQAPFAHPDALAFLSALKDTFWISERKSCVVNQGDEIDAHALGKWPTNPDGLSAGMEHNGALAFMRQYYQIFPKSFFCISNHTARPLIKAHDSGIPRAFLRDYAEFMEAPPGNLWRQRFLINDIVFEHGEGVSGKTAALRAAEQNRKRTSIGHQHSYGGVLYSDSPYDQIWGMNTGCLIDAEAYAFAYGKKLRAKPTLGSGVIIEQTPYFIPLLTNKAGRWTGKLPLLLV